ncbi:MAG: response regulator [Alphaproteobacteria bacterium]
MALLDVRTGIMVERVLVVDDDRTVRSIVTRILSKLGVTYVHPVEDGATALREMGTEMFDVVICDIEMEPMSGIDVLKAVRESTYPAIRDLPFLLLTSHTESDYVVAAKSLGCDDFVLKPVSPEKLRERIVRVLSKRKGF